MKKWLKVILLIIGCVVLAIILDIICIFNFNRPIFAIKESENIYRGLFYDTYNCLEHSVPQIKAKGVKFSCITNIDLNN